MLACVIAGCEKPQLRSGGSEDSEKEKAVVAEESERTIEEIRESVIGRRFEVLTLGSMQFSNALVVNITDTEIVIEHDGGEDDVSWSEVSDEVREKWGYDPEAKSIADKLKRLLPKKEEEIPIADEPPPPPEKTEVEKPKTDPRKLAEEIARKEKMLEAQLAGIRNIESDLSRHSQELNELKRQLQVVRASPSNRKKGGIFVERVEGKSTVVDRRKQAGELQGKINALEQLVAQLTSSLKAAREEYLTLRRDLDQLWTQ